MEMYFAGLPTLWTYIKDEGEEQALRKYIDGINMLESFYYADAWTEKVIPRVNNFLLDSGAFTFFTKGGNQDWGAYIRRYADFINRNKVDKFFELDIDALVGYEKVLEYRKMLEDLTGKKCIPVWHKTRGWDEFCKMCDEYDYISFGGYAIGEFPQSAYKYIPKFIDEAHRRNTKIHGLGFTSLKRLPTCHFDSVDSTSWLSGGRFGTIYNFDGKTLQQISKPKGYRMIEAGKGNRHNFVEWRKYAEYAKTHL